MNNQPETREGGPKPPVREQLEAILNEMLEQEPWFRKGMEIREAAGTATNPRERLLQEAERATALVGMLEAGDEEGIKRFFERGLRQFAERAPTEIARAVSQAAKKGKRKPPAELRPGA